MKWIGQAIARYAEGRAQYELERKASWEYWLTLPKGTRRNIVNNYDVQRQFDMDVFGYDFD